MNKYSRFTSRMFGYPATYFLLGGVNVNVHAAVSELCKFIMRLFQMLLDYEYDRIWENTNSDLAVSDTYVVAHLL